MRHASGAATPDVVAGCLKTFARAGKSRAAPASSLWARARNAVGSQAAETGRTMDRRVSPILGRITRSFGGVFGKDEQTSRPEGEGVTYVSRVCSKHDADRGWRDIEWRTNRVRDEQIS